MVIIKNNESVLKIIKNINNLIRFSLGLEYDNNDKFIEILINQDGPHFNIKNGIKNLKSSPNHIKVLIKAMKCEYKIKNGQYLTTEDLHLLYALFSSYYLCSQTYIETWFSQLDYFITENSLNPRIKKETFYKKEITKNTELTIRFSDCWMLMGYLSSLANFSEDKTIIVLNPYIEAYKV